DHCHLRLCKIIGFMQPLLFIASTMQERRERGGRRRSNRANTVSELQRLPVGSEQSLRDHCHRRLCKIIGFMQPLLFIASTIQERRERSG
ncbi:MAG TPA: hypothetical protein PLS58_14505, partial [Bacteroidales bacterium]|nr:hypothetical protein [Bacteroidales bacterium]